MDETTIIIIVISCCVMSIISSLIGTGIYATNLPKEGDECEGDDINADYEIDSDGACAFVDCKVGYDYDGVACAKSSTKEAEMDEETEMDEEAEMDKEVGDRGIAQEVVGNIVQLPGKGPRPIDGGIEFIIPVDRGSPRPIDGRVEFIIPGREIRKPVIENPMFKHYGSPVSLTDEQAQCYLNRYPDLQDSYGLTNIEAAKKHWITHGIHENRNYKCESVLDMGRAIEKAVIEMNDKIPNIDF